jgi:hypothetical protein
MSWLFGFSIQEFFICYFYCQKTAFVCEFQHIPLWKLMIFSSSTPCVGMRFCGHIFNSSRNKDLNWLILNLLGKVVFLDPKRLLSPYGMGTKKLFLQL